jgi:hypothetical protein
MLLHVCLLHHRGSPCQLPHLELDHPVLTADYASSVASQVTELEIVHRIRINWLFLLLAVVLAVVFLNSATIMPDLLMVVGSTTTSTCLKLQINQIL